MYFKFQVDTILSASIYSPTHKSDTAQSTEFDEHTVNPVIIFMPEISRTQMGGTMRLGLRPTVFDSESKSWSKIRKLYGGAPKIWERHRHRYEVNPEYVEKLTESGLNFIGKDEKGERMQVMELKGMHFPFRFVKGYDAQLTSLCILRPSLFRLPSSPPRILHQTTKSFTAVPRVCSCRM